MPRNKLFNEQEVLCKVMKLFWKQGYSATSIQDLVNNLGINRASLYDTYGGKEQLFNKAFEQYRKINTEGLNQFLQTHANVKEGLKKLFETAIDESVNDKDRKGCFAVNTTTELIPGDENVLKQLEENKRNFENLFYLYLKKGKDEGQYKTDISLKSIASLIFTLYNGLKVVAKIQPDKKELVNSVNIVLSILDEG